MADVHFPLSTSSALMQTNTSSSTSNTSAVVKHDSLSNDEKALCQTMIKHTGLDPLSPLLGVFLISIYQDLHDLSNFGQMNFTTEIAQFENTFFPLVRFVTETPDNPSSHQTPLEFQKKVAFEVFLICLIKKIEDSVKNRLLSLTSNNSSFSHSTQVKLENMLQDKRKILSTLGSSLAQKLSLFSKILISKYMHSIFCQEVFNFYDKTSFPVVKKENFFKALRTLLNIMAKPLEHPTDINIYGGVPFCETRGISKLLDSFEKAQKNPEHKQKFILDLNDLILDIASLYHKLISQHNLAKTKQFSLADFKKAYSKFLNNISLQNDIDLLLLTCTTDIRNTLCFLCDIQRMVDADEQKDHPSLLSNNRCYFLLINLLSTCDRPTHTKKSWKLRQEFVEKMCAVITDANFENSLQILEIPSSPSENFSSEMRLMDWRPCLTIFSKWNPFDTIFADVKKAFQLFIDKKLIACAKTSTNPRDFLLDAQNFWEYIVSELLLRECIAKISCALLQQQNQFPNPANIFLIAFTNPNSIDFKELFLKTRAEASLLNPCNFKNEKTEAIQKMVKTMTGPNTKSE